MTPEDRHARDDTDDLLPNGDPVGPSVSANVARREARTEPHRKDGNGAGRVGGMLMT